MKPVKAKAKSAKWSARVTMHSNALDLEQGVFTWKDPLAIATSLKRSAESSTRIKGSPYRSAMSMICFYENRAGNHLDPQQKQIIEQSKEQLRKLFGKPDHSTAE